MGAGTGCAGAEVVEEIRSAAERMGGKIAEAQTADAVLSRCRRVIPGVGKMLFILQVGSILPYGLCD